MKYKLLSLLLTATFVLSACGTTKVLEFHILSTNNIEIDKAKVDSAKIQFDMEASDGRAWFLIAPLASKPTIQRVVDRCLQEGNGQFFTKGTIYSKWWSFLLFSYDSYYIVADVANVPGKNNALSQKIKNEMEEMQGKIRR